MTDSHVAGAPALDPALLALSREFRLELDAGGVITCADPVAERALGAAPGMRFTRLCVPGTEAKAEALMQHARRGVVRDWELGLTVSSVPATVLCSALPRGDGVQLLGVALPSQYGGAIEQLNASMDEVVRLNRDLSRQRKDLAQKHDELSRAYRDLDDSNRGVVSLHAELAERNQTLRRASDVKTRLVANVSHEFRTPLHTILGLSRLLMDGADEPLSQEQHKQVRFIRTAAEELSQLVNDLLDLSKAESGKAILRPEGFDARDFIAALRGMLRPLASRPDVALVFEDVDPALRLETDHGKLSQIARNLISNALKFTERGEVRVGLRAEGPDVVLSVEDTGVGIDEAHFALIFEEFGQIEGPLQRAQKGTGLGLPLARRLAEMLGGTLRVESTLGTGSLFTARFPRVHPEVREFSALEARSLDPARAPVLVVEDDRKTIFIYEKFLAMAGFQVVPARDTQSARRLLAELRPAAIVLDIMLDGESSWSFLSELKQDPRTADIPVLVVTVTSREQKARALGADEFWLKPVDQDRLLRKLRSLQLRGATSKVLVIDDDERARYLIKRFLDKSPYTVIEADSGQAGVAAARAVQPSVILLDFLLQDVTAFDVLDELKADPRTRHIPVVIVTSHALDDEQRERLASHAEAVLSKENLSRELAINRIRDALVKAGVGAGAQEPRGATGAPSQPVRQEVPR
jgi:signal transduction histidine kinase/CheY-like chemotaxis protein